MNSPRWGKLTRLGSLSERLRRRRLFEASRRFFDLHVGSDGTISGRTLERGMMNGTRNARTV